MRQINDTTFISDNLGDLKPVVTIGGKSVDKFIPNLNMSFHNDEFFINLNRRDKQAINTTDKAEIDGTDKDIFYIDENGRFKWDIEFKERPSKNSWTWELKHAEGIEFYYQDTLENEYYKLDEEYKKLVSLEEYLSRRNRPIEVVGSYAVYCNKVNNKYKTGKLCHIYRPFCYDINRESIYADLKIADGQLTISIDEAWLDNAVYPVRLDPTIGYTTAGASSAGWSNFLLYNCTIPESGTTSSVYAYVGQNRGETTNAYLGLYGDISGVPGNAIEYNLSISVLNTGWYSRSLSGDILSSGLKYYPALLPPAKNDPVFQSYINYYEDSGAGVNMYYRNACTLMPFSAGTLSESSSKPSLYLEYTESGGALPAIINNYRQQGVM